MCSESLTSNGKLIRAATRGDGCFGEDITHNAAHFNGIPQRIDDARHIVIRGEAVIFYETFEAINRGLAGEKRYKNPRSMVSGASRFLDSKTSAAYGVVYIPFELVNAGKLGCERVSEELRLISKLGMTPVDWIAVNKSDIADTIARCEKEVRSLPYPTDGLVVVYDDLRRCGDLEQPENTLVMPKRSNGTMPPQRPYSEKSNGQPPRADS